MPADTTKEVPGFAIADDFLAYYKKVVVSDHPEAEQLAADLQKALIRVTRIRKREAALAKVTAKAKK